MKSLMALQASLAGTLTNSALAAVTDQLFSTISAGNRYILNRAMKVWAAAIGSTGLTNARISAPSLRGLFLPNIYPANVGLVNVTRPFVHWYGDDGPTIQPNEELTIEVSHTGAGPDQATAFLWLDDMMNRTVKGPEFKALATSSVTLVANGWAFGTLTFDQTLPTGRYAVTGIQGICTNGAGVRLVFPGNSSYRPGTLCMTAYGNALQPDYLANYYGEYMGEFMNTALPGIEVYGLSAGAQTATVFLDLVKIGSNPGVGPAMAV